jgi:hypothetical protein
MLDFFPTRGDGAVSVVPVAMTIFWIGWFVIGGNSKNKRNRKATAKATANCELQKQILRRSIQRAKTARRVPRFGEG